MRLCTWLVWVVVVMMVVTMGAGAQVLSPKDLRGDPDGMPGERVLRRPIDVGRGIRLTASIEVTTKGNGLLTLGGLRLKVVDGHDDGALYAGGMAHVEFADVDGDGIKELVVSGIAEFTDEKGKEVRERESFVFIYRYDRTVKGFVLSYKKATFDLADGPQWRE